LRELSPEELRVVLLHEFAHLRRWDDWTNLLQKLVRTIFFFHPAVWWIERRLSLEREMACDEAVLAETENPQAYAECLVSLQRKALFGAGWHWHKRWWVGRAKLRSGWHRFFRGIVHTHHGFSRRCWDSSQY